MKVPAKKRTAADKESWAAAQKLVQWSDARWRDRLLQLFEFLVLSADPLLVGKSRKTTVVGFDTLSQLRRSILPRIKDIVKNGGAAFKQQLLEMLSTLKADAKADLQKLEKSVLDSLELPAESNKKTKKAKDEEEDVPGKPSIFEKYRKSKTKANPDDESTECDKSEANDSEMTQQLRGKGAANDEESSDDGGSAPGPGAVSDCRRRLFEGDDNDLFGNTFLAAVSDGKAGKTPKSKPGDEEKKKTMGGDLEEKMVQPEQGPKALATGSHGTTPSKAAVVPYVDSEAAFKVPAPPVLNTAQEVVEAPVNLELVEMLSDVVSAHLPREQDTAAFFDLLAALGCTDPPTLLSNLDKWIAANGGQTVRHANFFIANSGSRQKFQRLSFSQKLAVANAIKTIIDGKDK
ncbi:unnamed protein product [Symbiodinium microadriaticum]|nr:unnamed protein product [Symbiodinium microadriaticum]